MINSLSILIPTYNNVCLELVRDLQAQASILSSENDFEYEIIVAMMDLPTKIQLRRTAKSTGWIIADILKGKKYRPSSHPKFLS